MQIQKGIKSFYVGDSEETSLAEMVFTLNDEVVIIEHTNVSDELSGQGVGKLLLKELVDWARKENKKITPHCTYAKAQLEKSEEYHDILY